MNLPPSELPSVSINNESGTTSSYQPPPVPGVTLTLEQRKELVQPFQDLINQDRELSTVQHYRFKRLYYWITGHRTPYQKNELINKIRGVCNKLFKTDQNGKMVDTKEEFFDELLKVFNPAYQDALSKANATQINYSVPSKKADAHRDELSCALRELLDNKPIPTPAFYRQSLEYARMREKALSEENHTLRNKQAAPRASTSNHHVNANSSVTALSGATVGASMILSQQQNSIRSSFFSVRASSSQTASSSGASSSGHNPSSSSQTYVFGDIMAPK